MQCNNKHCKYYISGEVDTKSIMKFKGVKTENAGGCKFPYCKINRKNARRR